MNKWDIFYDLSVKYCGIRVLKPFCKKSICSQVNPFTNGHGIDHYNNVSVFQTELP